MAIEVMQMKCPNCNGELTVERGRKECFCSYCGTKLVIVDNNEYTVRTVDEAAIEQAKTEQLRIEREAEDKKRSDENGMKAMKWFGIAIAIWFVFMLVMGLLQEFGIIS